MCAKDWTSFLPLSTWPVLKSSWLPRWRARTACATRLVLCVVNTITYSSIALPRLGLLTVNALVAADKLLIPIQCEFYALEGVTKLLDSMKRVKTRLNPSLDIFGVLLTMYDGRTTLSKQVVEEVRNYFGKIVFDTLIPRTVKLSEAPSFGQPITQYDPSGKGAQSYVDLAKEVINRG